jgi:hypothetical protein
MRFAFQDLVSTRVVVYALVRVIVGFSTWFGQRAVLCIVEGWRLMCFAEQVIALVLV